MRRVARRCGSEAADDGRDVDAARSGVGPAARELAGSRATSQSRTGRCCSARSRTAPVEARGLGRGGDNLSTAAALRALGVEIALAGDEARVEGVGFAGLTAAAGALDCGNSGTTIRLLMGLLAGRPFETELVGDASLTRRPMRRVAEPLRRMGATIDGRVDPAAPGDVFPPLRVRGGALAGISYDLPVASAQLKSALVLAGLQATGRDHAARARPLARSHRTHAARHGRARSPSTPAAAR